MRDQIRERHKDARRIPQLRYNDSNCGPQVPECPPSYAPLSPFSQGEAMGIASLFAFACVAKRRWLRGSALRPGTRTGEYMSSDKRIYNCVRVRASASPTPHPFLKRGPSRPLLVQPKRGTNAAGDRNAKLPGGLRQRPDQRETTNAIPSLCAPETEEKNALSAALC
ncbi:hypothetical protein MRX96_041196 [Rhipicephalus microplus]